MKCNVYLTLLHNLYNSWSFWNTLKAVAAETQPGGEILVSKQLLEKFMIKQENSLISNTDGMFT